MFQLIRTHQLNIMLALSAACMTIAFLLFVTRFLPKRRKWVLIAMEFVATFLLSFDRLAYVYSGDPSHTGYIMVRLSNFMVFFLTAAVVFCFNLFLMDMLLGEDNSGIIPLRLKFVAVAALVEMLLVIISSFTGLYYYFDENNVYHRGPGFLFCYVVPIICPLVQFTVINSYRKRFSTFIYTALVIYIFVPIAVGIIQIFTYGLSIVNMSMVLVSIALYLFTYLDINDEVERIHKLEMESLQAERKAMKRLFDQTATAFVKAVEKRDPHAEGKAERVAKISRRIAHGLGKTEDECDEVYYAALLHDVGSVAVPDKLLGRMEGLTPSEEDIIKKKPVVGGEILSNITEFPFLSKTARYSKEHFDGSGYPDGLKGGSIPEYARIVAVAEAYDNMEYRQGTKTALPDTIIREEFIKSGGTLYDPKLTDIMVQLVDEGGRYNEAGESLASELSCGSYRENISYGIIVERAVKKIRFKATPTPEKEGDFCAPSIILFDSLDRKVHDNKNAIEAYHYFEYGEVWFDGHVIASGARNIAVDTYEHEAGEKDPGVYEITAAHFEDHIKLVMDCESRSCTITVALPDKTKSVYIGLTGENCKLTEIETEETGKEIEEKDITRIASEISFIDRLESDIPNVQVDRHRSAASEGVPIRDGMKLIFHSMSLPTASLVWHCPFIVIYTAKDGKVHGKDYKEYAIIKLNGEKDEDNDSATNEFTMKKKDSFPGWNDWKEANKEGIECEVVFARHGNKIILGTENLGIAIENTTVVKELSGEIYAALTGDQVALTDIRVEK